MIVLELAQARDRVAAGQPAARGSGRWWSRSWLGEVPLLSCSALAAGPFQRRPEQVVKLVHQAAQVQGPGGDLAVLAGDGARRDQRREPARNRRDELDSGDDHPGTGGGGPPDRGEAAKRPP